jgi:hypothetical protein
VVAAAGLIVLPSTVDRVSKCVTDKKNLKDECGDSYPALRKGLEQIDRRARLAGSAPMRSMRDQTTAAITARSAIGKFWMYKRVVSPLPVRM